MQTRVEVYKETTENWYPSFEVRDTNRLMLAVTFTSLILSANEWRVCVWGADDFGMERDFKSREEAWDCFCEVIALQYVTQKALIERGFINA